MESNAANVKLTVRTLEDRSRAFINSAINYGCFVYVSQINHKIKISGKQDKAKILYWCNMSRASSNMVLMELGEITISERNMNKLSGFRQ